MKTIKSNAHIKASARGYLTGNYTCVTLSICTYFLFYLVLSLISDVVGSGIGAAALIITIVIHTIVNICLRLFQYGLNGGYLRMCCNEKPRVSDIFSCLTNETAIKLSIYISLLDLFFELAPLAIIQYLPMNNLKSIGIFLCSFIIYIFAYLFIEFTYMPAGYLLHDLEGKTAHQLMLVSHWMMRGHRLRLLVLRLSFIPLYIVGMIPLGLGLIYVYPYQICSDTCFYLNLADSFSDR